MLQSEERATYLMRELAKFAAETPFGLASSASGARQLIAYGSAAENVIDELRMLGDVAAGTGQSINDLVYLYGTLRVQGQAYLMDIRQFAGRGIPIYDELAKVLGTTKNEVSALVTAGKVGFEEVEKAFKNMTAEGSMFGGLMEKQSKSIGGRIEELKDNIDALFNTIGENSEGIIYESINAINLLVANYGKVGKLIIGLVATYGTYRTALILNTIATQTFATSQLQLGVVLARVQKAWRALTAAMSTNPYVLLVTVLAGLITTMWALSDATSVQEKAQERLNKLNEDATQIKQSLQGETQQLISVINSETASILQQIVAYNNLQNKYPEWLNNMSLAEFQAMSLKDQQILLNKALDEFEEISLDNLISKQEKIIENLKAEERTIRDSSAAKNLNEQHKIQGEILINLQRQKEERREAQKIAEFQSKPEEERRKILEEQLEDLQKQRQAIEDQIEEIRSVKDAWNEFHPMFNEFISQLEEIEQKTKDIKGQLSGNTVTRNKAFWEKQKKDAEEALSLMTLTDKGSNDWNKQLKLLNEAQSKLKAWDFSDRSRNKTEQTYQKQLEARQWLINKQAELDNKAIQNELDAEDRRLDLEQDSFDKRFRQNELNYRKELVQISQYENQIAKQQQEAAKQIFIQKNGTDRGFDFSSFNLSTLPEGLRPQDIQKDIDERNKTALDTWKKGNEDIRKEQNEFIQEEKLRFASQLDQQIADIKKHYTERLLLAKENIDLIKQLTDNQEKEIRAARLEAAQRQLEFEAQYNKQLQDLINERYVFEADKRAASLRQQIEDLEELIRLYEKQKTNDPQNEDLARQLKNARRELANFNKELAKTPAQKFSEIAGLINKFTNSLASLIGTDLSIFSDALNGLSSFATGDFLGAATSGLGIVTNFVNGIMSGKERQAQIQRELNKLQQEYNISLRQQNYDLISSIDYTRAFRNNIEALYWLIEKGFISDINYSVWESLSKQSEVALENFKIASNEYNKLETAAADSLRSIVSNLLGKSGSVGKMGETLNAILKDYENGLISIEEAWRRSAATGFKGAGDTADALQRASEETQKWKNELVELAQQMDEFATGTSFDGFLNDAMNAIDQMRSGISSLADFTEDALTNAVVSSFKYQILANSLKQYYDELSNKFINDFDGIDQKWANDWRDRLEKELGLKAEQLDKLFESLGIDGTSSTNQSPSRGAFEGMSQDTADELNGRFSDLQMSNREILVETFTISEDIKQHLIHLQNIENLQVQSLFELRGINTNTKELYPIRTSMTNIERGWNK